MPFPKTAPAAVRLLDAFTLTLLRKNSNTFLLLSLTFFGGKKKRSWGLEKGKGGRKMGGSIIFGSHNKQLAPFSLFEVGRRGGAQQRKQRRQRGEKQRERCSFMALVIWMKARRVHESARSPSTTGRPLGLPAFSARRDELLRGPLEHE